MRTVLLALLLLTASASEARPKILCTVGDSLVDGALLLSGNPTWTSLLQTERRGQGFAVVNFGIRATTAAQALTNFNAAVKGHGCTHVAILTGTNSLAASVAATAVQSSIDSLVASAKADTSGALAGINVTVLTVPPRGGSASWDATKETQRLALRTSILASSVDAAVDLEPMAGTGSPVEMAAAYRYSDFLHFNGTPTTGGSQKVADLIDAVVSW